MTTLDPGGATWQVFLSEQFGFCRSDPAEIAEELADSDSDYTTINVVRGSALPIERDGGLRLPGTWSSRDLYELSLDDYETPQERAEAWKLAQAAAWGMSNPDASEEVLRLRSDYEARGSVIESLKREVTQVSLVARRTADENDRLKAEVAEHRDRAEEIGAALDREHGFVKRQQARIGELEADQAAQVKTMIVDADHDGLTRFDDYVKTGALWGPGVEGNWYAYRDDIAVGTLRFADRESGEKFLRAELAHG